jgi:putative heme-binding domain-containing protein
MRFLVFLFLACRACGGAYSLFDGSFNGWEGDTKGTWRIEENVFTAGSVDREQPRNEFLSTKREFGDFDLSVSWKLIGTEGFVNGGVQFRTKRIPNDHEVSGYQADLGAGYDGALYDESRRNKMLALPSKEVLEKARKPLGEWNRYRIRAEGRRIQIWLNGVQTVDYTEADESIPLSGIIAVQIHGGAKSQVWYKDLAIEELNVPAAPTGPTARFADPQPAPPREPFADGKFVIRQGEVIVFTGGTNMVRLVEEGGFEGALALAAKEQKPRFRSMAWEGDTVYEQWRDMNFGSWKDQLDAVNATCVFLWFGQMEALDLSRDEAAFAAACAKHLDEIKAVTPRLVVMLPMPFDDVSKNGRLGRFAALMKRLAMERGAIVLDWPASEPPLGGALRTINGVHVTDGALRGGFNQMLVGALGLPHERAADQLLGEIRAKNRHWHDCWKTMNWAFAYSDRTEQPFGKGIGSHPPMAQELERYKPLLRAADEGIQTLAAGGAIGPVEVVVPKPGPLLDPAEELGTFKVRDGFLVNLFASEADGLVKPLSMRWDARGRLWAACSPSYPQLVPGEAHGDYVLVCEDTDGDGKADKFQRFASGLTMPMGIEFATDGGVYICESTQLAKFRDTDGDGRADERTVILSGFGTGDSHQMINSLRWGPDGCLWFSQGLHIFSRIETPHGIVQFDRAGLWRFDPRSWKLQGFFGNAAAGANCWGVTFDDRGQVFHCAADNTPGFYTTPGLGTLAAPPQYYNIGALAVSPVKGMCLEFISSSHLPPDLQGVLCKPVYFGSQVLLYRLADDGSGFRTDDLGPLITSSSNVFRPLGVQTGPDGALYVCDWFNPVIGHYQASYRDPNRDKTHGRVWRISAKDRPLASRPALESMDATGLREQLESPERWVRDQARRLLAGMPDALPDEAWQNMADASRLFEMVSLAAMRGEIPEPLLLKCLSHDDAALRAFAVRLGSQLVTADASPDALNEGLHLLANAINDPNPRVRLEGVVAAGYFGSARAVEAALTVLDHPRDRFIDYALANTIRASKSVWAPALEAGKLTFEGNVAHLAHLLQTDGNPDTAGAVARIIASGKAPAASVESLRVLLIGSGNPEQLAGAVGAGPVSAAVADALTNAARGRGVRPSGDLKEMIAGMQSAADSDGSMLLAVYRLAGAWGMKEVADGIRELFTSPSESTATGAVQAWAEYKGAEAIPDLSRLAESGSGPVRMAAAGALLRLNSEMGQVVVAKLIAGERTDPADAAALLGLALSSKDVPAWLGGEFGKHPPSGALALAMLKALVSAGRNEPVLAASLRKAAGLPENASIVPDYAPEIVQRLVADARASGDAARGASIFRAPQSGCLSCHKVGDEGGLTGPNLTAVGRGMTPELIAESVLWPHRQIKEGYFLTTITTRDSRVTAGYKVREDDKTIVLRIPGTETTESVVKADVMQRQDSGSLMPEGLTAWMTEAQRLDLLRFLFDLGK